MSKTTPAGSTANLSIQIKNAKLITLVLLIANIGMAGSWYYIVYQLDRIDLIKIGFCYDVGVVLIGGLINLASFLIAKTGKDTEEIERNTVRAWKTLFFTLIGIMVLTLAVGLSYTSYVLTYH